MDHVSSFVALLVCLLSATAIMVHAEDPHENHEWKVSYGTLNPLGVPKQVILINDKYIGPTINVTSNTVLLINVINNLDEPLLFTWNGIQHRKNSWSDGTLGTMCPIMPGTNFTYRIQVKDQIGSFFYFPSTGLLKSAGGIGSINIQSRPRIPIPFTPPTEEFNVLLSDWYNKGHKTLARLLDSGRTIARPDGIIINGKFNKVGDEAEPLFTMVAGKTYRYRVCNVGMKTSLNFRIQGHTMKLVELEGSHTIQNVYDSLDIHVGQCVSVLVTANKDAKDYYMVASSRFAKPKLQSVATIRYASGKGPASPDLPPPPPENTAGIYWSLNQFRSFRYNLTASAARPNPQGSYHYGKINVTRTILLANTMGHVDGKLRYGINGVSHINPQTPLKLAEYFGIANKTFKYNLMPEVPPADNIKLTLAPNVFNATFKKYVEIILENREKTIQTWNLGGHSFFAVDIEPGKWSPEKRKNYNLADAVYRHNIHVYPKSFAVIMTSIDNAGMWNLRSAMEERAYLGQELYISVLSPKRSSRDELNLPENQLLCGDVVGLPKPPLYT